jgi:hypothetical protein
LVCTDQALCYTGLCLDIKIKFCYNYAIMKPIQFIVPEPKQRRHRALFDRDLPFRQRVERPKTEYRRRAKHQRHDLAERD